MKVVLFCGGLGLRMRDGSSDLPKPMVPVGGRPLIWHVMRYYAHFGHREFVLCLGHGATQITDYFLSYKETDTNDFILEAGSTTPLGSDIDGWRITFAHTGIETPIGERLRRVAKYVGDDEVFLANYADVLTDAPLDRIVDNLLSSDAIGSMLAVPPQSAFHVIDTTADHRVDRIRSISDMPLRENGGYFVFRRELLDHLAPGDDLVGDTLTKLAGAGRVIAYPHDGFWMPADTVKERVALDALANGPHPPWELWRRAETDADADATHTARPRGAGPTDGAVDGKVDGAALRTPTRAVASSPRHLVQTHER